MEEMLHIWRLERKFKRRTRACTGGKTGWTGGDDFDSTAQRTILFFDSTTSFGFGLCRGWLGGYFPVNRGVVDEHGVYRDGGRSHKMRDRRYISEIRIH